MAALKNIPSDMRIVSEVNYRAEVKKERQAAKELAASLASELGVDEATAVACAACLERPLLTEEDTADSLPGQHCWTPEARRIQFETKVRALQAKQAS